MPLSRRSFLSRCNPISPTISGKKRPVLRWPRIINLGLRWRKRPSTGRCGARPLGLNRKDLTDIILSLISCAKMNLPKTENWWLRRFLPPINKVLPRLPRACRRWTARSVFLHRRGYSRPPNRICFPANPCFCTRPRFI